MLQRIGVHLKFCFDFLHQLWPVLSLSMKGLVGKDQVYEPLTNNSQKNKITGFDTEPWF